MWPSLRPLRLTWLLLSILLILFFYGFSMAGCVSSSVGLSSALYSVQIGYGGSTTQVRVGYFGVCAGNKDVLNCQVTSGTSADLVLEKMTGSLAAGEALDTATLSKLVPIALVLQKKIILHLIIAAVAFFLLSLIPLFRLRKVLWEQGLAVSNEQRRLREYALVLSWASVIFSLASVISIHQATSAMQFLSRQAEDSLLVQAGIQLVVFGWIIFVLSFLFSLLVSVTLTKGRVGVPTVAEKTPSPDKTSSNGTATAKPPPQPS